MKTSEEGIDIEKGTTGNTSTSAGFQAKDERKKIFINLHSRNSIKCVDPALKKTIKYKKNQHLS